MFIYLKISIFIKYITKTPRFPACYSMQLPLPLTLSRSKSAHLAQKPSFITSLFQPNQRKNNIKLLKQSFPPDFFLNSHKKNDFLTKNLEKLPFINDLKGIFSHKTVDKDQIPLNYHRIFVRKAANHQVSIDIKGYECNEREEVGTPCFPLRNKKNETFDNKKSDILGNTLKNPFIARKLSKRKVLFCKERD